MNEDKIVIKQANIDKGKLLNFYSGNEGSLAMLNGTLYLAEGYAETGISAEFGSVEEAEQTRDEYNKSTDHPTPYVLGASPLHPEKLCFYHQVTEESNEYIFPEDRMMKEKFYLVRDLLNYLPDNLSAELVQKYSKGAANV